MRLIAGLFTKTKIILKRYAVRASKETQKGKSEWFYFNTAMSERFLMFQVYCNIVTKMQQNKRHSYGRIYIEFDPDVKEIIVNQLPGKLGKRPPDVVKNIVRIYLAERGYFR